MLNDRDLSICGSVTLSPRESAALADACAAKADALHHECRTKADERLACYYDLLSGFFYTLAVATARGMQMTPDQEKQAESSLAYTEAHHD